MPSSNRYSLPTREEYLLSRSGYIRDYALLSLHIDGHPKRYDEYKYADMDTVLKREYRKLYLYSRRVRFIGKYRIGDEEGLRKFIDEKEKEIGLLKKERESTGIRRFPSKGTFGYEEYWSVTARIREAREDIRTARDIMEDDGHIKGILGEIERERIRNSERER